MAIISFPVALWALASIFVISVSLQSAGAFDTLDPYGDIAVKWDIMYWTGDGYTATVTLYNRQQFRAIKSYKLGWTWGKKEVIYAMSGATATEQGDCSKFPSPPPLSCEPRPTITDLVSGVPLSQQFANCCRDGYIAAKSQDEANSISSFSITVGNSGNLNTSVVIPQNLTFGSPLRDYTCSDLKAVAPTKFTIDGKRVTHAYLTWNGTCTYSQYLASKAPTCCVGLSAFYSDNITECANCSCACGPNVTHSGVNRIPGSDQTCISTDTSYKDLPQLRDGKDENAPSLYCTNDMCPVRVHWHIKEVDQKFWRAIVTITNRNYLQNYSNWNIVVQHENFADFTRSYGFEYKPVTPYLDAMKDTALFWGVPGYNQVLQQAGPNGNVQSELLFAKDSHFTLAKGWGFPTRVLFNGDECVLPNLENYPALTVGA